MHCVQGVAVAIILLWGISASPIPPVRTELDTESSGIGEGILIETTANLTANGAGSLTVTAQPIELVTSNANMSQISNNTIVTTSTPANITTHMSNTAEAYEIRNGMVEPNETQPATATSGALLATSETPVLSTVLFPESAGYAYDSEDENGNNTNSGRDLDWRLAAGDEHIESVHYGNLAGQIHGSGVGSHNKGHFETTPAPVSEAVTTTADVVSPTSKVPIVLTWIPYFVKTVRLQSIDTFDNYGNKPLVHSMRRQMSTRDFAAQVALHFPLLVGLESTDNDMDAQESLVVVLQEATNMLALTKALYDLETAHVTRNGNDCLTDYSDAEINYFCDETKSHMDRLIDALGDLQVKLQQVVPSEITPISFHLPYGRGNAQTVCVYVLSGLYQIQERAMTLEAMLRTIS